MATKYLKQGRLANSMKYTGTGALTSFAINMFMQKQSGRTLGTSALYAGAEAIAFGIAPGPMSAYYSTMLVGAAIQGGIGAQTRIEGEYRQRVDPNPQFSYRDSQQAMTMRQAAVEAIQGSKLNARNALGGEAALMHRSKRIY